MASGSWKQQVRSAQFPENVLKLTVIRGAQDFAGASVLKNLPANEGDASLIPGSRRSLGEGNSNPLRYSCLGNPMDRTCRAIVHGIAKESCTTIATKQ